MKTLQVLSDALRRVARRVGVFENGLWTLAPPSLSGLGGGVLGEVGTQEPAQTNSNHKRRVRSSVTVEG
jgi:hypothetical protein